MYLLLITHADDGRVLGSWRALCAYLVHFMRVTLLVSFLYASAFLMMGSGMKLRPPSLSQVRVRVPDGHGRRRVQRAGAGRG